VLGNTPLEAGLKLLVWTGAIMLVSPAAGYFSERYGSRLFMVTGLLLQAIALGWLASVASVDQSYASMLVPFVLGGSGMALVFAPAASAVLASVRTDQAGQASGATNAIRELGGVLGIAVLSTVFSNHGSYASAQDFVNGLQPTMWVGTAVLATGALIAFAFRFDTRTRPVEAGAVVPVAA
jgi:MFS family permease